MKPAQVTELRRRLAGNVSDAKPVCEAFATDGSVLRLTPAAVAYPRSPEDVQAAVAYAAEQAAKATKATPPFSVVARGAGTNYSGGALGDGLMLSLSTYLDGVTQVGKDTVTVQPGVTVAALQAVLRTHGRWLPAAAGTSATTAGGLVAGNGSGERALKYGAAAAAVKSLKVVLDDGSLVETRRLSRWELNRKKGLMTREGDLYRGLDGLLQDHQSLIKENTPKTARNAAGYRLEAVKRWDGSFDLSQLIIGAQGTLGVITEITFTTAPLPARSLLLVGYFETLEALSAATLQLRPLQPSALEMVDAAVLERLRQHHPELVAAATPERSPAAILLVEFDTASQFRQNRLGRRAARILRRHATSQHSTVKPTEQQALWALRRSLPAALWLDHKPQPTLPIIEDACVPPDQLAELASGLQKLLKKHKLPAMAWGSAGEANLHALPSLDLSKAKDRKTALKLMDEVYALVIGLGGTTSASHGDGMLRAPYLEKLYGADMYQLLTEVKQICDPAGIFNPRAKFGTKKKDLETLLRQDYSRERSYRSLPYI